MFFQIQNFAKRKEEMRKFASLFTYAVCHAWNSRRSSDYRTIESADRRVRWSDRIRPRSRCPTVRRESVDNVPQLNSRTTSEFELSFELGVEFEARQAKKRSSDWFQTLVPRRRIDSRCEQFSTLSNNENVTRRSSIEILLRLFQVTTDRRITFVDRQIVEGQRFRRQVGEARAIVEETVRRTSWKRGREKRCRWNDARRNGLMLRSSYFFITSFIACLNSKRR